MNASSKKDSSEKLSTLLKELPLLADRGESWSMAFNQGEFASALSAIENQLSQEPTNAKVRLWWIACQLEIGELPLTALSAPLEEVLPEIKDSPGLFLLASRTLIKVGMQLIERDRLRLGVSILEKAFEFASLSNKISEPQQNALLEVFHICLKEELERAELRRESPEYCATLKDKIEKTSKFKKTARTQEEPAQTTKRKNFTSKSILEQQHEENIERSAQKEAKVEKPKLNLKPGLDLVSPLIALLKRPKYAVATLLFISLLFVAGFWDVLFAHVDNDSLRARLSMHTNISVQAQPVFPILERLSNVLSSENAQAANLDDLKKRLSVLVEKEEEAKSENIRQEPTADPEVDQNALAWKDPKKKEEAPQKPLPPDDNVDRDYVRGAKPQSDGPTSIFEGEQEAKDRKKIPSLDPNVLSKNRVEQVGSPNWQRTAVDEISVSPDGRTYNRNPLKDQNLGVDDGRVTMDGTPLKPLEVTKFDEPKVFRVLKDVEVQASPSMLAKPVSKLEANSKVHAAARFGQWLEVVSTKGRKGYIFAQDAIELKEKASENHRPAPRLPRQ